MPCQFTLSKLDFRKKEEREKEKEIATIAAYPLVLHQGVRVVLFLHEILEHVVVALRGGEPNRRASEIRFALRRGPALDQQFNNVEIASASGAVQRRPPVFIGRVYFCSLAEQNLDHLVVAVSRGDVQAGFTVSIRAV